MIWAENMLGSFFVEKIIFYGIGKKNRVFVFNWVFENGSKDISCHFACSKIMNISYKHASGNIGCTKEFRDREGEGTRKWWKTFSAILFTLIHIDHKKLVSLTFVFPGTRNNHRQHKWFLSMILEEETSLGFPCCLKQIQQLSSNGLPQTFSMHKLITKRDWLA